MATKSTDTVPTPLTPRVLLILWGLAERPQHGYRLLQLAESLGRGQVSIGPASLYESIHSLEARGLIEPADPPDDEEDVDSRRRYFRLTTIGRDALESEARRVATLADDLRADGILSGRGDA